MARVLIVEDNDLNMKLFNDLLLIQHCEVMTSRDGTDLMNLVSHDRPDLILMDIQLGKLSGIDLIKELKSEASTSDIPIIAITAFAMKNEEARIRASGCDMYLSKPVSIDVFFKALQHFIGA